MKILNDHRGAAVQRLNANIVTIVGSISTRNISEVGRILENVVF